MASILVLFAIFFCCFRALHFSLVILRGLSADSREKHRETREKNKDEKNNLVRVLFRHVGMKTGLETVPVFAAYSPAIKLRVTSKHIKEYYHEHGGEESCCFISNQSSFCFIANISRSEHQDRGEADTRRFQESYVEYVDILCFFFSLRSARILFLQAI
jgi:hypothetical protein